MKLILPVFLFVIETTRAQTIPTAPPASTTTLSTGIISSTVPTAPTGTISNTVPTAPTRTTTSSFPTAPTNQPPPGPPNCSPSGISHHPHPNCQYFYICIYGQLHEGRCENETLWDVVLNICRNSNQVDCGPRFRPNSFRELKF
jgi:Chitin binding Peritrophin-A domain